MQRWKEGGRRVAFGVQMHAERRFAGVSIPVRFTGWWDTPDDGDFFRGEITAATFR